MSEPAPPARFDRTRWIVWGGAALIVLFIVIVAEPPTMGVRPTGVTGVMGLKAIRAAQEMFSESDRDHDGVCQYASSLADLSSTSYGALIDGTLGSGTKGGYLFALRRAPDPYTRRWMATARPILPGTTGDRSFVINQDGAIFYTTGPPFDLADDCAIPARAVELGR